MARTLALVLALLSLSSTGCSFLVHFDRDRIGSDGGIDAGAIRDGGTDARSDGGSPCAGDTRIGMACDVAAALCETGVFACVGGTVACMGQGAPRASTTECRPAAGLCDAPEMCDGTALGCPAADAFRAAGTECRADAGECDVAETCNGTQATCPVDAFETVGTVCAAGFCDAAGACSATCTPGGACARPDPCELGTVACAGTTPSCVAAGPAASGVMCRPVAGACDVAETCDGTATLCPSDGVALASVECRASAGDCDLAEMCDGTAVTCPSDAVRAASVECRAAPGLCDVAETCSGSGPVCPADALQAATTECRATAGLCDLAETCDGSGANCPVDGFRAAAAECRASAGSCDVAEVCTGSVAACPANGFATAGAACSPPSAGACAGGSDTCACAAPLSLCTAACVDVRSSVTNCGACGTTCGAAQDCVSRFCVGDGLLAIAATYSRAGDGNLLVTTPGGMTVWSGNVGPNAGTEFGAMDRADTTGTGPENVFWAAAPPSGTYHVCFETTAFTPAVAAGDPVTATATVRRPAMAPVTLMRTFMAPTTINGSCAPGLDTYLGAVVIP